MIACRDCGRTDGQHQHECPEIPYPSELIEKQIETILKNTPKQKPVIKKPRSLLFGNGNYFTWLKPK